MTITAPVCPNCGAPLTLDHDRCAFCHVTLVDSRPGAPVDATPVLPPEPAAGDPNALFSMPVDDVFTIAKRGTVVTGRITAGTIRVGDTVLVEHAGGTRRAKCTGIEMFRKQLDTAGPGENVGLLLDGVDKKHIAAGDWLRSA